MTARSLRTWMGMIATAACVSLDAGCHPRGHVIAPRRVTAKVAHDSDDPAIWINPSAPERSLVLGTDKHADGALYVFNLRGEILADRVVPHLKRPNNVDVEYGLLLNGRPIDIAVCTEADAGRLRIFRLPDLVPIDGGGIDVFAGEAERRAMGIALYRRPRDQAIFAIVSRGSGPPDGLLWQYRLVGAGEALVRAERVRTFGSWRGRENPPNNEVEAVAVDDALGFVYYAEELVGIHKYAADPDAHAAAAELALFGTAGFAVDREGIAIYPTGPQSGYLLVSDQSADQLRVFERAPRQNLAGAPELLATVPLRAAEIDGVECTAAPLGAEFPHGLLVVMNDDRTFQFYAWQDLPLPRSP